MQGLKIVATAVAMTLASAAGASTTIDFNTASGNNIPALTIGAVTFTANGGGGIFTTSFGNTPNGTRGIVAQSGTSGFVPIRATIAGGATSVSVDIGDYNSDADSLFLRLYDASDVLLATATGFIPAPFVGLITLSASAAGTAYAVFGGVGFGGESNVYSDNFTFDGTVPEPATWALMIGGFGLCGTALRRRRAVATA